MFLESIFILSLFPYTRRKNGLLVKRGALVLEDFRGMALLPIESLYTETL